MNFSCDTMTENQIFPMSADLFDTSSNSSNPLKYDLYSLGLSNSNSSNALFGSSAVHSFSPLHQLTINTSTASSTATLTITTNTIENNIYNQHQHHSHNTNNIGGGGSSSSNSVSSNVMLTNAITIPRSNNPNQSHHNPYQDESHHHPSPSPLQHHILLSHLSHNHHPQMMSSSSSSTHSNSHPYNNSNSHINNGGGGGSGGNSNAQNGQQQQQHQQHHHQLSDLNDYALDALDASLSPTLMHDVSLSAASPLNSSLHSITPNGNVSTGFYAQDESPISGGGNSGSNSVVGSVNTGDNSTLLSLSGTTADDVNQSLIYDVHGGGGTPNSNTMWSDIGSAIVTTKNEPFTLEDDIYIFPIDKTEIQSAGFPDINDDNFLEDIGNIEDFLPSVATDGGHSGFLLSPQSNSSLQQLNSPQASPGGPPLELLQQQQQMQHQQQRHQQQQQLTQLQTIQSPQSRGSAGAALQHSSSGNGNGSSGGNGNNGGGGAMHHSHHNHHSSSSPYDIYHSTPNKQQQQSSSNTAFSPGSQPSHSPLQQVNSITPPPPPHANRSQYSQQSSMVVKSRNMQELIKKGFSMSPDRNSNNSSALLGQSVPGGGSHMLISGNALSPGSGGSSGFGSTTAGSVRKSFGYQSGDASSLSRLSSSAPTHLGFDHIWVRREPRQHLLSTGSLAEAESFSSLSTGSVLSPDGIDFSQDDDEDGSTDDNSDHYDDFSSDNGSDNEDDPRTSTPSQLSSSKGKERYFWQYNVQAKGPKGKRLVFQSKLEDPHVLNEVTDPVFSPNCSVRGIKVFKHSGKARKGDGNDLTPNPRKLHSIGKELDKLSRTINDMTPVSELPFNVRPKSRKEKNKLASRACRLKKKAQHEANKIKLFGLEIEHKRLLNGIAELKQALALKYRNQNVGELNEEVDQQIERIYKTASTGIRIAGGTTDFVNKVLDNIKSGVPNGGLEEIRNS